MIKLDSADLFGNDAAEDEEQGVFESYVFKDERAKKFLDPAQKIAIAKAYKGEGKSALLRIVRTNCSQLSQLCADIKASTISPDLSGLDTDKWVRVWKKAIIDLLASEVGARIDVAWSDDSMALVELAEKNSFKSKSIVSAILDRIKTNGLLPIEKRESGASGESLKPLQRYLDSKDEALWVVIDDVDQNFQNTPEYKAKIASCFIAARETVNAIPQLRIRLTIRPNIWALIKPEYEALTHVEQYMHEMSWDDDFLMKRLLSRRVEGYLTRHPEINGSLSTSGEQNRDDELIAQVFESPLPWGGKERPPHVVLHTLSKHRPRWLIQLCKSAAIEATKIGQKKISLEAISNSLNEFGRKRLDEMKAEFRSQCEQVGEYIGAFARAQEEFKTDELLAFIRDKVISNVSGVISGIRGIPTNVQVAAFLFEIGFLSARQDNPNDGSYVHFTFAQRPLLLSSRAKMEPNIVWEIHPAFRQALGLRDAAGRIFSPARERAASGTIVRKRNRGNNR